MPKRNVPLTTNTAYHVYREDGSHYTVYSKQALDRRIEDGRITKTCRVTITKVNN